MPTYRVTDLSGRREMYLVERDVGAAAVEWRLRLVRVEAVRRLSADCLVHDAWGGTTRVAVDLEITAHATPRSRDGGDTPQ
jgi:hypothetical protein